MILSGPELRSDKVGRDGYLPGQQDGMRWNGTGWMGCGAVEGVAVGAGEGVGIEVSKGVE